MQPIRKQILQIMEIMGREILALTSVPLKFMKLFVLLAVLQHKPGVYSWALSNLHLHNPLWIRFFFSAKECLNNQGMKGGFFIKDCR